MIEQPQYKFSSTQLNLEGQDREDILNFIETFIDKDDLSEDGIEYTPHITVKYGLHDNRHDKLKEVVKTVKPITVRLGKTSIFNSSEFFDVVKIDVLSKDLRELNRLIKDNLESTDTFRTYSPHLTLAYVKKGMGEKYINNEAFKGRAITFDKLIFSPVEGDDTIIYFSKDILN